jgi:predicted RecA/RadA family phage recombinase
MQHWKRHNDQFPVIAPFDVVSNQPFNVGSIFGFAMDDAKAGEEVAIKRYGVFETRFINPLGPGTEFWPDGTPLYYCPVSGRISAQPTDFFIGYAYRGREVDSEWGYVLVDQPYKEADNIQGFALAGSAWADAATAYGSDLEAPAVTDIVLRKKEDMNVGFAKSITYQFFSLAANAGDGLLSIGFVGDEDALVAPFTQASVTPNEVVIVDLSAQVIDTAADLVLRVDLSTGAPQTITDLFLAYRIDYV